MSFADARAPLASRWMAALAFVLAASPAAHAQSATPTTGSATALSLHTSGSHSTITGVIGDTTIAGGWTAFTIESGMQMEPLRSPAAEHTSINSIPSTMGPEGLVPNHVVRYVGSSWGTWSHGYTGQVISSNGAASTNYTMPVGVAAFDAYLQPVGGTVATFVMTGFCSDGSSTVIAHTASGAGGARHFGFYCNSGATVTRIHISANMDFAIGETRIAVGGVGSNYCTALPNSTGQRAFISATGSASLSTNDLTLRAYSIPNQPFIFFHAADKNLIPFGDGYICAVHFIERLGPPSLAVDNLASYTVDLTGPGIVLGTRNFQCWYRDPAAAATGHNLSDGLSILFTP